LSGSSPKSISIIDAITEPPSRFYVAGGTLNAEASCYVERKADQELFDGLQKGEFCYVLTSRQMGKSSLMVRAVKRLREAGTGVAVLDLTAIGQNLTSEQWYAGLLLQLGQQLNLQKELVAHWQEQQALGSLQRWFRALCEVVLVGCPGRIVVFVDEIDIVRSLEFSVDEFFAGIRQCYNERSNRQQMERLSFGLLGVAAPVDLVRDTRMTPFNIGRRIELRDFTEAEAIPLARGFRHKGKLARSLLGRVLYWTGGHPYLTQRLCLEASSDDHVKDTRDIDRLCFELFLSSSARVSDDNLLFVRQQMLYSNVDLPALLEMFRHVRSGRRVADDHYSPVVNVLQLSGITRTQRGRLRVRNRIYSKVFDQRWIRDAQPDAELQRQRAAFRRGLLRAALVATCVIALLLYLAVAALKQAEANRRMLYDRQLDLAQQELINANSDRVLELLRDTEPRTGQAYVRRFGWSYLWKEADLRGFEWYHFWKEAHNYLRVMTEDFPVLRISPSPDGRSLAAAELPASKGENAKLWLKMKPIGSGTSSEFEVPFDAGFDLTVLTPDSQCVVADPYLEGEPVTATMWDLRSGRPTRTFKGHSDRLSAMAISVDGRYLATADVSGITKVWNVQTGGQTLVLPRQAQRPKSLAFSPDAKWLVSTDDTSEARLWDSRSGKQLPSVVSPDANFTEADFFPDGQRLLTATGSGQLQVWNLRTRRMITILSGHTALVLAIAFSPDGRMLATGSYDRTVKIWSATTVRLLRTIKGHGRAVNSVAWSSDGSRLITGSADATIKIWDVSAKEEPILPAEKVKAYFATTFTSSGDLLALGITLDNHVKLWNLSEGIEVAQLDLAGDRLVCAAFSPDAKLVATGSMDNVIRLTDVVTGQVVRVLRGHSSYIYMVAFSPDGRSLVSGGKDQTIRLWNTAAGQQVTQLKSEVPNSWFATFSPDGKYLASASGDGSVRLWESSSQRLLRTLHGHTEIVSAIAFSPDSQQLVTGSYDASIRLWDLASGKELKRLGQADRVQRAVFSPDGKRLVTGGVEGTVKLWDMITGQELMTLEHHADEISSVTFTPDGMGLATSSMDGTVSLLRAARKGQ
jgi:WD40 repeat protein